MLITELTVVFPLVCEKTLTVLTHVVGSHRGTSRQKDRGKREIRKMEHENRKKSGCTEKQLSHVQKPEKQMQKQKREKRKKGEEGIRPMDGEGGEQFSIPGGFELRQEE